MSRSSRTKHLYQRGSYWLDWDKRKDGSLRSPYLTIFWYDEQRKRVRSVSTSSDDLTEGTKALDRNYEATEGNSLICLACGQMREPEGGVLVLRAIADYLGKKESASSIDSINARLAHVINYIATLPSPRIVCEQIDESWISGFRIWLAKQPMVSTAGNVLDRDRSLSTVENSVLQLAAALNSTRSDGKRVARFKPIPTTELNRTPQRRLTIHELADAFRYATDPRFPTKRSALHRFLILSVATLSRPDAVHDFSTAPGKRQWNADRRVICLNPEGRRQTKKYRATVIAPKQLIPLINQVSGFWIPGLSVRSAWETMVGHLGWPAEGEGGMKLIRRSIAQMLRDAGTEMAWSEDWRMEIRAVSEKQIEVQLGHRKIKSVTDLYAFFRPAYLSSVTRALESIIEAIINQVPNAFTLSSGLPLHELNEKI